MRAGFGEAQSGMRNFLDDPKLSMRVKGEELVEAKFRRIANPVYRVEEKHIRCEHFYRTVVEPIRGTGAWQVSICPSGSKIHYYPGAPF